MSSKVVAFDNLGIVVQIRRRSTCPGRPDSDLPRNISPRRASTTSTCNVSLLLGAVVHHNGARTGKVTRDGVAFAERKRERLDHCEALQDLSSLSARGLDSLEV